MISDLHTHTCYSCDSETTMKEYCEEALIQGVSYICFTDHVDFNLNDFGYNYYRQQAFFEDFKRTQDKYSDKITLLSGIEFSEPHLYKKELDSLLKLPYDFVLGSIHCLDDLFVGDMLAKGIKLEEIFKRYWDEVYEAVEFGEFDSLAHIDFPKRYYEKAFWDENTVKDIFRVMVKNKISLEINTSSLRKGHSETMPGKELLQYYEKVGGTNVTIGSDAHSEKELAKGYMEAVGMLTPALVNGFYRNRRFNAF